MSKKKKDEKEEPIEPTFDQKHYITIKIARSKHIIKTRHFKIDDLSLGSTTNRKRYKVFKLRFEPCTYGSKQHILIHKLAERGFEYAFIINDIEDIKNPMGTEIPIVYLKNGKPKDHYDIDATTTRGQTRATHIVSFLCQKISAYFVVDGQIDFDGDHHAKKDKNLIVPQLELQQIGFENI